MKTSFVFVLLAALGLWLADCAPKPTGSTGNASPAADRLAAERAKSLERAKRDIAGKEKAPSDSVYLHVTVLKKIPAGQLLEIMDHWGAALGVGCDHCHVDKEWASEVKAPKEIARQMIALTTRVNKDIQSIQAIKSEEPGVSCYTCHHGDVTPRRRPK